MRLQSAIFDMDGTLLDSMGMWRTLGSALVRRHGVTPPPDLDSTVASLGIKRGAAYCKDAFQLPGTPEQLADEIWDIIEDFYQNKVQAKPGVLKALSLLKMEGVWMYIATATDRPLAEAALKHAGIDGFFRGMLTSREVGSSKHDSPKIYEYAMRRLRSTKGDTVIFEDAFHAVRTAKDAGFRVAAIFDPSEPRQDEMRRIADYYFTSFEELFTENPLQGMASVPDQD